ncbi:MAG TPA: hypothetical protein DCL21_01785 [Alphaproteobacteria bacterium]|nr:hypothetical protein [Alphaproteobacteria bacterium]
MKVKISGQVLDNEDVIVVSGRLDYKNNTQPIWKVACIRSSEVYYFFQEDISYEDAAKTALMWESISIEDVRMTNFDWTSESERSEGYQITTSVGKIGVGFKLTEDSVYTFNTLYGWPNYEVICEMEKLASHHISPIKKGMLFSLIGEDLITNIPPPALKIEELVLGKSKTEEPLIY